MYLFIFVLLFTPIFLSITSGNSDVCVKIFNMLVRKYSLAHWSCDVYLAFLHVCLYVRPKVGFLCRTFHATRGVSQYFFEFSVACIMLNQQLLVGMYPFAIHAHFTASLVYPTNCYKYNY